MQTFNRLQEAFPGKEIPATVVVKAADVNAPEMQAAIRSLSDRALETGRMHEPITVEVNDAGTVANIAIPVDGQGNDEASNAALAALRGDIVPETVGALPGVETAVTGHTAYSKDSNDQLKAAAPLVFGFVLVFAFVLMLMAFRSVAIAIKAIVLNLLSVAAAYGVLVLVFQHGVGQSLLGVESTGGIVPFLPIFLFVILFGLSMDYHVFILSRIRELYDRGASTDEAISHGHQEHRRRRHQRRDRHGRRLRDLRDALDDHLQAVRRRPRRRRPDRRDHRPRGAPARDDEAPGRAELVVPAVARVASDARARPRAGAPGRRACCEARRLDPSRSASGAAPTRGGAGASRPQLSSSSVALTPR